MLVQVRRFFVPVRSRAAGWFMPRLPEMFMLAAMIDLGMLAAQVEHAVPRHRALAATE
jgi:hypothetical protein